MAQPLINVTSKQAYLFACFLVFYEFLTYIANDMIMPAMIQVVNTFHGPESAVATSLTAYVFGGASLQLILGPVSDRYGRRPVMIFGAIFFFLCTALIAISQSMDQFLLARFFQGMGLCFIGVIGYATLQEIFEEADAIRLLALMANVAVLAPLIGPLLGAVFILHFNWRFIFVAVGLLTLISLWGIYQFMPEPVGQMTRDGRHIQQVPLSIWTMAKNYKTLISNRTFLFGSITLGLVGAPCIAWIALAPVILITDAKLSVVAYGVWQIPVFSAAIIGNWLLHQLTHHFSIKKILWTCSGIVVVSLFVTLLLTLVLSKSYYSLMPGLIAYFLGLSLVSAPLGRLILFATPIAKGTASALMTMIVMGIQGLSIEVANILYSTHDNTYFGIFCTGIAVLYSIFLVVAFRVPLVRVTSVVSQEP